MDENGSETCTRASKRDEIQEMRRRKAMEAARAKPLDDDSAAMAWQALGMSSTISIEASSISESVVESTPEDLESGQNHDLPNTRIETAENSSLIDFQKKSEEHEMSGEEVAKDFISDELDSDSIEIPAMIDLPPPAMKKKLIPLHMIVTRLLIGQMRKNIVSITRG